MKTLKNSALSFLMLLVATVGLMSTSPAFANLPVQCTPEQCDNSAAANAARTLNAEPAAKEADTTRYAKREELAKKQVNYQGGDGVIAISITSSAVVLIVLLIILL